MRCMHGACKCATPHHTTVSIESSTHESILASRTVPGSQERMNTHAVVHQLTDVVFDAGALLLVELSLSRLLGEHLLQPVFFFSFFLCNQVFNTRQLKTLRQANYSPKLSAAKTAALQTQPTMQEYYSPVKAGRPTRHSAKGATTASSQVPQHRCFPEGLFEKGSR